MTLFIFNFKNVELDKIFLKLVRVDLEHLIQI
jgi:hypothetical protein